ncbi:hypothetical protein [Streptomyces sp. NPDC001774]
MQHDRFHGTAISRDRARPRPRSLPRLLRRGGIGGGDGPARPRRDDAEAVLVEHYPRLLRLAHLVLPPGLGRHNRVLVAHALVQNSLAGARRSRPGPRVPAQGGSSNQVLEWLQGRVVAEALRAATRTHPFSVRPLLPSVLGLRLFPGAGGDGEAALDRALGGVSPEVRAAFALLVLEERDTASAARLLAAARVREPAEALMEAERLRDAVGGDAESLLQGAQFDPCTVQTRPTDLLRRRQRRRLAALAAVLAVTASGVLVLRAAPATDAPNLAQGPAAVSTRATDPQQLVRAPAQRWADTARVDLTTWPARGTRTDDTNLLARALGAWSTGGDRSGTRVIGVAGTPTDPPVAPPRLLYAGTLDASAVVLLYDEQRVARYAEPLVGRGPAVLELARADDTDVTTGAALVVSREAGTARFLLAPWIDQGSVRDLRRPDLPARPLTVSADGATISVPAVPGDCGRVPVVELRSSTRIVEDHTFLLADLGGLAPAHLTWTPGPGTGAPARQPREATSPAGLDAWARSACTLPALRDSGVRAVNRWEFARQSLPERGGPADWTCLRAESWEGSARVTVALEARAGEAMPVRGPRPEPADTAACSRFGQHMLAGTYWTAPSGARYYLAAGSRHLSALTVRGAVSATARGPALAVRAEDDGPIRLVGTLPDRAQLHGWGEQADTGSEASQGRR